MARVTLSSREYGRETFDHYDSNGEAVQAMLSILLADMTLRPKALVANNEIWVAFTPSDGIRRTVKVELA